MNLYVLVEGRVTEMMVYSRWIPYLINGMTEVSRLSDVKNNNFYMFSGYGYPSIIRRMAGCINDINRHGNIDYLVVCLDSEEESIEQRYDIVMKKFYSIKENLSAKTKLKVIVHHRCIETWFLGNRNLYKERMGDRKLRLMLEDYNIFKRDPEELRKNPKIYFCNTTAQYHYTYLKHLFNENKISYTKKNPGRTMTRGYLKELIKRTHETPHLKSFAHFVHFCNKLNSQMHQSNKK